ncbi:hypothetical protein EHH54_32445 [Rhizobium leguminosarum]|uniref:hypothetical protein n=1 Tax=Rhizobium leguminosarum TaxID=384 RepID=UPI000FEC452B|nr:hypothetical protein [Rhizobium leguminosarum]RWX28468.1 hypothetical protein EHH54_32445 [Rhizobium leguminosarum]
MGDIPEDIKVAAEDILDELTFVPEHCDLIVDMLCRAILAERQRCAEVVTKMRSDTGQYVDRELAALAILRP